MHYLYHKIYFTDDNETAKQLMAEGKPVAGLTENVSCTRFIIEEPKEEDDAFLERVYRRLTGQPVEIMRFDGILIREFCMEDMDALFQLYSQPHVTEFLEGLYEYEEEKVYQQNYIDYIYGVYDYGMWLVFEEATGRLIGRAGLESRETCQEGEAELGYIIAEDFLRQGYATKICQKIMEYGFKEIGLKKLLLRIEKENKVSCHLAEKLGFTYEGEDGVFSCFFKMAGV